MAAGEAVRAVDAGGEKRNVLLSALTSIVTGWEPRVDSVELRAGDTLVERGAQPAHLYFPVNCVLSMLTVMGDGRAVEFATVGWEGASGASEILTGAPTPMRIICQVPGVAERLPSREVAEVIQRNATARLLVERYVQSLFVQAAQVAACNRLHPVEERCARWLLMTHDRVGRDQFMLTQEFLSQMLGVRRARVNVAAGILQRAGLIRYSRGRVRLTDRPGLEAAACECYGTVRADRDLLLSSEVDGFPGSHAQRSS